jgi:hypothetical protein
VLALEVLLWCRVLLLELLPVGSPTMPRRTARLNGCRAAAPLLHRHLPSAPLHPETLLQADLDGFINLEAGVDEGPDRVLGSGQGSLL